MSQEGIFQQAMEIVKAQASVRNMTEDEMDSMIKRLVASFKTIAGSEKAFGDEETGTPIMDPKKAIREKSITCLECGKTYKILTKNHLASHGLTPREYKEKYGYKRDTSLTAKSLARERRKKMQDMKLWERRDIAKKSKEKNAQKEEAEFVVS